MTGFEQRVVLVTGGAAGIGHACVRSLVDAGAVVHALDRDAPVEAVAGAQYHRADLRDQAAVETVVEAIVATTGRLDVLVNNAGISFVGDVETGSEDEWHLLWDVNVLGYVRTLRAALPHLRRGDRPAVVNMTSCTAESGFRDRALYSATKGAVEAMTRSVAADLVSDGITVNAVSPGTVDTPFMTELAWRADDPAGRRRDFEERQPTGQMVDPAEVAHAVLYLTHPLNRSSVGTVVTVDGGIAALHLTRA